MKIQFLPEHARQMRRRIPPNQSWVVPVRTAPVELGQSLWARLELRSPAGHTEVQEIKASWQYNQDGWSHWQMVWGPFVPETRITYQVEGNSPEGHTSGPRGQLRVGADIYVALLWHQHQPIYKDTSHPTPQGSYTMPWVRLHALRDYYGMAALLEDFPQLRVTFNLTPSLLWQLDDYVQHQATDRALDLTRKPAEKLTDEERAYILQRFFDADREHQILCHPRYSALFQQRQNQKPFTTQDIRDLQMWFNLAWFGQEFRRGMMILPGKETASVQRWIEQESSFSVADIEAMLAEQYKIMRAVVPLHLRMQEQGQIEVSTTPLYHPILPLLYDTCQATIDRPNTTHPSCFSFPQDAELHVVRAISDYEHRFGRKPRGMWPAEGAVSKAVLPLFASHGIQWLATDRGVLERSGRWGYHVELPDVECQPYRAYEAEYGLSIFFRDPPLANEISFHLAGVEPEEAAQRLRNDIHTRLIDRLESDDDRIVTIALDGENAWGSYPADGRPFLRALYRQLSEDDSLCTITPGGYITGDEQRNIPAHPLEQQTRVYELFTGSWIDERGSAPGVDLGTWIGEAEENQAWNLLLETRKWLELQTNSAPKEQLSQALEALYMAEGSDWFWWFGDDQESGQDDKFDDLFRTHLKNVYRHLNAKPPASLDQPIVPRQDKSPQAIERS